MNGPQSRSEVVALLGRHGLVPRRRLGQHFLVDPNITRKIAALAEVGPGSRVLEIGAGTGTLTAALAETGARVLSFEVDTSLRPLLAEVTTGLDGVELVFADATAVDLRARLGAGPWVLCANLPYHVGTPLILDVLRHVPAVVRMVVMVQEEVADRLVAAPGSKVYGVPSVVVGLHADARLAFLVPPQVFLPPPNVSSAVVVLDRRPAHPLAEEAARLAGAAFARRRKMLRGALAPVLADPDAVLADAGIPATARAESVPPEGWVHLAAAELAHG